MAESTRRFLEPLVGLDPNSVRIHRGADAGEVTNALHADALTAGDDVLLGPAATTDSPETLGLLAHELTHVARRREPRFVPPVARLGEGRSPGQYEVSASVAAPTDEEALARRVEAWAAAAAHHEQPADVPANRAETPATLPLAVRPPEPTAAIAPTASAGSDWGGLPAPWEPLPSWLTTASAAFPASETSPAPPATTGGAPAASTSGIQLAEPGRSLEEAIPAAAQGSLAHAGQGQPEPDLDALARQVYSILRRRLAVERRRAV